MSHHPDSPEGVAFALMKLIIGADDPTAPPTQALQKRDVLLLYRECLAAVRDEHPLMSGEPCVAPMH